MIESRIGLACVSTTLTGTGAPTVPVGSALTDTNWKISRLYRRRWVSTTRLMRNCCPSFIDSSDFTRPSLTPLLPRTVMVPNTACGPGSAMTYSATWPGAEPSASRTLTVAYA